MCGCLSTLSHTVLCILSHVRWVGTSVCNIRHLPHSAFRHCVVSHLPTCAEVSLFSWVLLRRVCRKRLLQCRM
jgi:hypothetical protein